MDLPKEDYVYWKWKERYFCYRITHEINVIWGKYPVMELQNKYGFIMIQIVK